MSLGRQAGFVTGATSGIGRAIALSMASAGMNVGLLGRDSARLEAVAAEARKHSVRIGALQADLGSDDDIRRAVSDFGKEFGGCDILVHSAAAFHMGAIGQASVQDLDELYRINVRAAYVLTQALLPGLSARRGQIVFINSSAGIAARAGIAAYAATKHALKALADALRAEVNDLGVRVLTLYVGRTATPLQKRIHECEGAAYLPDRLLQPQDVAQAVISALELPRTAEVTDINIRPMLKS